MVSIEQADRLGFLFGFLYGQVRQRLDEEEARKLFALLLEMQEKGWGAAVKEAAEMQGAAKAKA